MDLSYFNSPLLSLKALKHSLRQCFMSTLVSSLLMNPSQLVSPPFVSLACSLWCHQGVHGPLRYVSKASDNTSSQVFLCFLRSPFLSPSINEVTTRYCFTEKPDIEKKTKKSHRNIKHLVLSSFYIEHWVIGPYKKYKAHRVIIRSTEQKRKQTFKKNSLRRINENVLL